MLHAKDWLTKVYDFHWYYHFSKSGRTKSAFLLKRKDQVTVTSLYVKIVDNREEYYNKL